MFVQLPTKFIFAPNSGSEHETVANRDQYIVLTPTRHNFGAMLLVEVFNRFDERLFYSEIYDFHLQNDEDKNLLQGLADGEIVGYVARRIVSKLFIDVYVRRNFRVPTNVTLSHDTSCVAIPQVDLKLVDLFPEFFLFMANMNQRKER